MEPPTVPPPLQKELLKLLRLWTSQDGLRRVHIQKSLEATKALRKATQNLRERGKLMNQQLVNKGDKNGSISNATKRGERTPH